LALDIAKVRRTVPARHREPLILNQTAKKIEQEESSENNAFGSSFSISANPLSGGGGKEAGSLATSCRQ
jgi:hypothetical protein